MTKKTILLVDDEEAILASVGWDLEHHNFEVTTANDGGEATDLLRTKSFDLVITDLMMPQVDGFAVLQTAKSLHPEIGVIILTGFGDVDSAVKALKLGADDYLQKPCDIDDLLIKARRGFERQDLVAKLQEQNMQLSQEMLARRAVERQLQEHQVNLEQQVKDRTIELTRTVEELKYAITTLVAKEKELQEKNRELQNINTTLSTLLKRRAQEHNEIRREMATETTTMVLPLLKKAETQGTGATKEYLKTARANLLDVLSKQPQDIVLTNARLAPRELQIVHYLRQNKTSKEMADLLGISVRTVESYRENIRKKLRITNQKKNLKKFLTSLL
jgi:DNA-binding response OmpR family regulator/DNA-binding CsgD family transcriptional regulator